MKNKKTLAYSVTVPLMNEEENVELLYDGIVEVMDLMDEAYEIVFIDDGSTDKTFEIMQRLQRRDENMKVIKFRRNFGQSAAMGAGFEYASGNIVIAMDGDLQNDPKDIPKLVSKLKEGYDIVSGWRQNRQDKVIIRKIPSKIANGLIRHFTQVPIQDTGCSLKAYTKEIVKKIRLYGELHRFIPALARIEGARIGEVPVNHHARQFGSSKYNITRTLKVIMDLTTLNLFLKYLRNPMHFFGTIGIVFNLFGVITLLYMFFSILVLRNTLEEVNVLLSTAFIFIAGGFQSLFFGLLANLVVKTGDRKSIGTVENGSGEKLN
ncbi:glycosyltransferase family 2 protein [candidate division KSB1 bacterium]|nr:glycosyltransferase family 2 protein [candidate division KSB1 bacterium]TDI92951.1 MAG: glycosyltransferase [Caldithrix sp.]